MSSNIEIIKNWIKLHPIVLQLREENNILTLKEFATGKIMSFNPSRIVNHRLKEHPQGLGQYLNLVFEDQTEIVLCHAGIAFSPVFVNTAPLPDAPSVVCMTDYFRMLTSLHELLKDDRKKETLLVFQVLISILDGAKHIGFDVAIEEKQLDEELTKFEKSFVPQ